ncbi:RsmE family RNA methyltransferase [Thermodesulfovibrio thiophilus]|uniref:RsmE family RNA methyltransferase n=1 Tax=Thermodesulfovibrio thiophilus TaxID=340095 RepID=UPI000404E8B2|nr:RsmE family RNA methyltransferase [Thermodesulfovibrio thiophilus]
MSDRRICIQSSYIAPGVLLNLSMEDRKYLFNVMRCSHGDLISVTDGRGKSFKAKIINKATIEIIHEEELFTEDDFSIVLCQGILKGEKMETVIQKATELGVKKIVPFISERCVIRNTTKLERWKKIAKEATEQSGRSIIPEISDVINFSDLIKHIDNGIIFWEKERLPLIQSIHEINHKNSLFLLIGPEGGFSSEEVKQASEKGLKVASLGKRILRAETASIVSVGIVSFLMQNYDIIKK